MLGSERDEFKFVLGVEQEGRADDPSNMYGFWYAPLFLFVRSAASLSFFSLRAFRLSRRVVLLGPDKLEIWGGRTTVLQFS